MPQPPNLSLNLPVRQDSGNVAAYYKQLAEQDDFDDDASSYWDGGASTARTVDTYRNVPDDDPYGGMDRGGGGGGGGGGRRSGQQRDPRGSRGSSGSGGGSGGHHQQRQEQPRGGGGGLLPLREDQEMMSQDPASMGPFSSGLNRYSVGVSRPSGGGARRNSGVGRDSISAASGGSFMGYVDAHGGPNDLDQQLSRLSGASNFSTGSTGRYNRGMRGSGGSGGGGMMSRRKPPVIQQSSASKRGMGSVEAAARPGGGDAFFAHDTPSRRDGLSLSGIFDDDDDGGGAGGVGGGGGGGGRAGGGAGDFEALPTPLRGGEGYKDFKRATRRAMGALGGVGGFTSAGGRRGQQKKSQRGDAGGGGFGFGDGGYHDDDADDADYYDGPRAGDLVEPGTPSVGARTPGRWDPELDAATTPGAVSARRAAPDGGESRRSSQMTEAEITRHYERIEQEVLAESGGVPLARLRDPQSLWNGGRHALCKLTRAGRSDVLAKGKGLKGKNTNNNILDEVVDDDELKTCYLSRNYTEGMRAPTAFVNPPPQYVLCQVCGDVAWEPVRDAMYSQNRVFCRACLCIAEGDEYGNSVPEDQETTNAVMNLKIMCRNALVGARTQQGALVWRMDVSGCPETATLRDRNIVEARCMYALEECGLPRGKGREGTTSEPYSTYVLCKFFSHFTCVLSSGQSRSGIVGRWVITTRPVRDGCCWGGLCNTSEPPKIQNLDKKKYHQTKLSEERKYLMNYLFSQKHQLQKNPKMLC